MRVESMSSFPTPLGFSHYPPRSTALLTHDETVQLLRNRGFTTAAADFAADKAGPAYITYRGERRFSWDAAFAWGRDRPPICWEDDGEDDPPQRRVMSPATCIAIAQ
jgi:hypothetical protein